MSKDTLTPIDTPSLNVVPKSILKPKSVENIEIPEESRIVGATKDINDNRFYYKKSLKDAIVEASTQLAKADLFKEPVQTSRLRYGIEWLDIKCRKWFGFTCLDRNYLLEKQIQTDYQQIHATLKNQQEEFDPNTLSLLNQRSKALNKKLAISDAQFSYVFHKTPVSPNLNVKAVATLNSAFKTLTGTLAQYLLYTSHKANQSLKRTCGFDSFERHKVERRKHYTVLNQAYNQAYIGGEKNCRLRFFEQVETREYEIEEDSKLRPLSKKSKPTSEQSILQP